MESTAFSAAMCEVAAAAVDTNAPIGKKSRSRGRNPLPFNQCNSKQFFCGLKNMYEYMSFFSLSLCVLSSHLFWTSGCLWTYFSRGHTEGRSHRISPPSFCGACLIFFSREGFSRSFPSSAVKSNFALT